MNRVLDNNSKLVLTLLAIIALPKHVAASDEVYKYRRADGSVVFSDIKPKVNNFQTLKFDCYACNTSSLVNWQKIPLSQKYQMQVKNAAKKYGVDSALIRAVIHAESAFKPNAISKVGAQGLMQLMPETASYLGVKNPFDVTQNINGGAHYLQKMLKQFKGDISLATAAYNAGPTAVKKYKGIPPYKETKAYVERVAILYKRYQTGI
ncbi:lytic transglycosylase domain-containing protein [Psychrobium sp. MM17-31]|uniref:lytic transglycosylase domain-containing protein n=1 Tax=Psychrobium sp. MM17-31 TaxID=2917758 RepID=UPI001EF64D6C|nr:lytic transglycosylase domain-containing protein [Psychrobium sp. MM17-31]MCG7530043.1 lytic transglycosylase domain-containing protein [Psychrobium sp. MM17-31]